MLSLLDIFFPPVCPLCEEALADGPLCVKCSRDFSVHRIKGPICRVCGLPFLNSSGPDHTCGECVKTPPPFKEARSAYIYSDRVDCAVKTFKYGGKVIIAPALGALLSEAVSFSEKPELIIPVPLHKKRLQKRGFNQSLLLAKEISKRLSMKLDYLNLKRIRHTEQQVKLKHEEREKNVAGAFKVTRKEEIRGRRVLLVDDVFTTGATIKECSRALAGSGAEVYAITLARAAGA